MKTLREYVAEAREKKVAIGHFNISDSQGFWAVVNASKNLNLPVIIGVSEGERDFIGVHQIKALVDSVRANDLPVFLNADHTYSFDKVKQVIDAGFDSVIFDGANISFEENKKITTECVHYAKNSGRDVLVEGELGYIGQSSKVLDQLPEGVDLNLSALTTVDEAVEYATATGIDMLAPAVGNVHGMMRSGMDPKLSIERVKAISEATQLPLVLHGGSGNSEADFKDAIANGVAIVHINTEIRLAYRQSLQKTLAENLDEVAPYKFLRPSIQAMQNVIETKLKLFNNL
jgi:fructose-bisphosphate aldolase class II